MAKEKSSLAHSDFFRDLEEWEPFSMSPLRALRFPRWAEEFWKEGSRDGQLSPLVDVTETDKAYQVSVEVPGVDRNDITIECKGSVLSIHGEKKSERDEKKASARVLERRYGAFRRSLTLPTDADVDHIHATHKDGILTVEIQKRPEAKSKTISIKD